MAMATWRSATQLKKLRAHQQQQAASCVSPTSSPPTAGSAARPTDEASQQPAVCAALHQASTQLAPPRGLLQPPGRSRAVSHASMCPRRGTPVDGTDTPSLPSAPCQAAGAARPAAAARSPVASPRPHPQAPPECGADINTAHPAPIHPQPNQAAGRRPMHSAAAPAPTPLPLTQLIAVRHRSAATSRKTPPTLNRSPVAATGHAPASARKPCCLVPPGAQRGPACPPACHLPRPARQAGRQARGPSRPPSSA